MRELPRLISIAFAVFVGWSAGRIELSSLGAGPTELVAVIVLVLALVESVRLGFGLGRCERLEHAQRTIARLGEDGCRTVRTRVERFGDRYIVGMYDRGYRVDYWPGSASAAPDRKRSA